jgi:acetyl-CoA acetyltransferase family protein
MDQAVIVAATRTPIGRAHKGALAGAGVDAFALARVAVQEVVDRAGIPVDEIDDLVLAESLQGGGVIARHTAVELGLTGVPGMADNRHCAAGLSAIQIAAGSIMAGMDRAVIAGGTESLSTMVMGTKGGEPWMSPSHTPTPEAPAFDMALTVGENTARLAGISRAASDEWALQSHQRAATSRDDGRFAQEIVPVPLPDGSSFIDDEHPRADTNLEKLASLPVLHPEIEGATVTAGNAAGLNDAAAAVMLTSDGFATAHGLAPLARIRSWASVGVDPVETGLAPTLVIPKALERAGLTLADVDLFEVNEAFCSVAVATSRRLDIDPEIMNVNGSGCGLGHPIAATGARMVVTMLHELRRRSGGMGSALVLELV